MERRWRRNIAPFQLIFHKSIDQANYLLDLTSWANKNIYKSYTKCLWF